MYTKQLILMTLVVFLAFACGESNKSNTSEEKANANENMSQEESSAEESEEDEEVVGDLNNQGVGSYKDIKFEGEPNPEMVAKGKALFDVKCIACHTIDKRLVGPAMKGIYKKRNPSWVLNMIAHPEKMLEKDKDAIALKELYGGQIMLNMQLKDEEVRAIGEYLRTL